MRRSNVQDAAARASGAVYMPLLRVQETDGLGVWHFGHISAFQATRDGRPELLRATDGIRADALLLFLPQLRNTTHPHDTVKKRTLRQGRLHRGPRLDKSNPHLDQERHGAHS